MESFVTGFCMPARCNFKSIPARSAPEPQRRRCTAPSERSKLLSISAPCESPRLQCRTLPQCTLPRTAGRTMHVSAHAQQSPHSAEQGPLLPHTGDSEAGKKIGVLFVCLGEHAGGLKCTVLLGSTQYGTQTEPCCVPMGPPYPQATSAAVRPQRPCSARSSSATA